MTIALRGGLLAAASVFALTLSFTPTVHAQQTAALADNPELAAKGVWNPGTTYAKDDIVTARGSAWISRKPGNVNRVPGQTNPSSAAWWQLFARGFNPTGAWSSATTYQPDDLVTHNGQTYRAKLTGNKPVTNTTYWELLVTKGAAGATGPQGPAGPNTGIGNGTSSAPSISFSGDSDTGIYHPADDKIALVQGGILFLHSLGDFNAGFGLGALENNTGILNTAVGHSALSNNSTGGSNTALGAAALINNTTGGQNTAVGAGALNQNESGANNTAVGDQALQNSTTADNTAVGYQALKAQTIGFSNTAVGAAALATNTGGVWNVAVGNSALGGNTAGSANVAIGRNALLANTSGASNVAVGDLALSANTTAIDNVAVGRGALAANTTGSSNSALGRLALTNNQTGSSNVAIGHNALSANATGNGNVAIGQFALGGTGTGLSNVAIGANAGLNAANPGDSISIGNLGASGDNATIKIGTQGTQTSAFMAGIAGVVAGDTGVLVDSTTGQLGVAVSSRRYKSDIETMADVSAMLAKLRPVTFRYKQAQDGGQHPLQYGLIAEEVADVFPDLAVFKEGQPETVKYHLLPSFLLAGYQAQQTTIAAQAEKIDTQAQEIAALKQRVAEHDALEARLQRIEALLPQSKAASLQ